MADPGRREIKIAWDEQVFDSLLHDRRHKTIVVTGGRSSGKSFTMALVVLLRGLMKKERVLCVREFQTSLKDSVMPLMVDLSDLHGLGYQRRQSMLVHPQTGTEIVFHGLSEQTGTARSIKSFHNATLAYGEEGQFITDKSWKTLAPTIREEGAQTLIAMNPRYSTDPLWRVAASGLPSVRREHFNFDSNHALAAGELDAIADFEKLYPEDFAHEYLGALADEGHVRYVISPPAWAECIVDVEAEGLADIEGRYHAGLDCADTGSWGFVVRRGPLVVHAQQFSAPTVTDAVTRVHQKLVEMDVQQLYFDQTGVGGETRGALRALGATPYAWKGVGFGHSVEGPEVEYQTRVTNKDFFSNRAAQMAWTLRRRAANTRTRRRAGEGVEADHCLFVDKRLPQLSLLTVQASRPQWEEDVRGRVKVNKDPDDEGSPHVSDAMWLAFAADSKFGLRAKGH